MTHAAWPVTPEAIVPFLIAVTLIELTPGPNMGYLAALSATEGRDAGLRAVAGITLGLSIYMLAAVFGVAGLIAAAPIAYAALHWAGVLYLLYLAWEAWRGAGETSPGHEGVANHAPFVRGLVANLLNPKAAVFYISLLPGFVADGHAPFWTQALIFGSAHILVSVAVHSLIVFSAAGAGAVLARFQFRNVVRKGMAIAIGLIATWIAFSPRN